MSKETTEMWSRGLSPLPRNREEDVQAATALWRVSSLSSSCMLGPAPPPASLPIAPHLNSSIVLAALLAQACFPLPTALGRWKQVPQPGLCSCLWQGQLDNKYMCSPASPTHSSACCHQSQQWSHVHARLEQRWLRSRCTPRLDVPAVHGPLGSTLHPKGKEIQLGSPREGAG